MQYRTFGKSGLKTSAIGFGGWPMGKGQYGAFEEDEVVSAVHRAIERGVTLFDTAARYGVGFGEELLGKALKGRRQDVVIVTKGGTRWNEEKKTIDRDSSEKWLRECLEGSLKRLGTDYVDLYLIHWPDEARPMQEPMEAFAKFQREGKIRFGGVSNFSVKQMEDCLKHFPIITNQVGYNLFDRRPEAAVLPFVKAHGMGIMSYGSLSFGLLTGTMTKDTKFASDDWRRSGVAFGLPIFKEGNFEKNLAVVEGLKAIAKKHNKTVAQLAVAWVLSNPTVSVALTGIRTPQEIEENVGAAEWKLAAKDKQEIEAAFEAAGAVPARS